MLVFLVIFHVLSIFLKIFLVKLPLGWRFLLASRPLPDLQGAEGGVTSAGDICVWQSGEISVSRRGGRESGSSIPLRSAEAPLAHEEVLICSLQRVGMGGWGAGGVGRLHM